MTGDALFARRIKEDWRQVELDEKTRMMLEFAERITQDAPGIRQGDIERLRTGGFTDEEILDVVLIASLFNYMVRIADALGVEVNEEYYRM